MRLQNICKIMFFMALESRKKLFHLFSVALLSLSCADSAVIAAFDFENANQAVDLPTSYSEPHVTNSEVSVGSFTSGSGFTGRVASGTGISSGFDNLGNSGYDTGEGFLFANRGSGVNTNGTQAQAFSDNEYFEITVTPNANHEISFTTLSFYAWVNDKSRGADQFGVTTSIDGHTATNMVGLGEISPASSGVTVTNALAYNIDLSGAQFQNVTSATTFRIYVWDGGSNTSASLVGFDNLVFDGTVSPIPEPSSNLLLAFFAVCCVMKRKR